MDSFGKCDPFVMLSLNEQTFATEHKKNVFEARFDGEGTHTHAHTHTRGYNGAYARKVHTNTHTHTLSLSPSLSQAGKAQGRGIGNGVFWRFDKWEILSDAEEIPGLPVYIYIYHQ
jgi:hypothetical protein